MTKPRVLSGIQPSGKLHLGNLIGALENWVKMQAQYDCFFEIADLHALTTGYDNPKGFRQAVLEVAIDLLSVGIDPKKSTVFVQSDVPEHCELHLLLSMITPLPWLERVPTYKGKIEELKGKDLGTYGFLGYPVLQAADILIYKAAAVPVGQDQLPHLELTREIARRFNFFYGPVFPEPKDVLTPVPVLPGLDGKKMSKSYGNTIALSDSPAELTKKVLSMITDPARVKKTDKGHPEICPVFAYHKIFNPEMVSKISAQCQAAELGCVECKKILAEALSKYLTPVWERRAHIAGNRGQLEAILRDGAGRAQAIARVTLDEVKDAMGLK
ncbi:MAG: tryptophan--tRNA ligase [Candidatus Margulisiibacteriota bacterium]